MTSPAPEPTGLDIHAAFQALYPGLHADGYKVHQIPDDKLRVIVRAASLRRAERERVKGEFLEKLRHIDGVEIALSGLGYVLTAADKIAEEIR